VDGLQLIRRLAKVVLALAILAGPAFAIVARTQGMQPLVERTASMAPAITPGDVVLVARDRADRARPGDVITFADPHVPGRTITHRLLAVRRAGAVLRMTTRGDANRAPEHWVIAPDGTVGNLRATVPLPASAVTLIDRTPTRGAIVAALSLLCCGMTLRRIWRRRPASALDAACVPAR
jgi:signal peptidase I